MPMPEAAPPGPLPDQPGSPAGPAGWRAVTASERGAAHIAADLPSQDAVASEQTEDGGLVAAVADGHGHWRHFRSASGARLAVEVGCQVCHELAARLSSAQAGDSGQIAAELTGFLVPELVRRWRSAVLADLAADPLAGEERDQRLPDDDPTVAYGSTLLLAVTWRQWLLLAQIGDGDIVCVGRDGQALLPVPGDPSLDGRFTTSLCGPDAASDVRVAVVDTARTPLLAAFLATDGYGNAQAADPWAGAFSKDIAGLLSQRGADWLAGQLPGWAARCASPDGSADDTTVALLLAPGRTPAAAQGTGPHLAPTAPLSAEATTIPAKPERGGR